MSYSLVRDVIILCNLAKGFVVFNDTALPCAGSLVSAFSHTLFRDALLIPLLPPNSARMGLQFVLFSHHSRTDIPSSQHTSFSQDILGGLVIFEQFINQFASNGHLFLLVKLLLVQLLTIYTNYFTLSNGCHYISARLVPYHPYTSSSIVPGRSVNAILKP